MKPSPRVIWKVNKRRQWVTFFYRQPVTNKRVKVRARTYDIEGLKVLCVVMGVHWEVLAGSLSFGSLLSQYISIVTSHRGKHTPSPSCLTYII